MSERGYTCEVRSCSAEFGNEVWNTARLDVFDTSGYLRQSAFMLRQIGKQSTLLYRQPYWYVTTKKISSRVRKRTGLTF